MILTSLGFRAHRLVLAALALAAWGFTAPAVVAQTEDDDLQVFGYFQARFYVEKQLESQESINTFNLQQLNLFVQHRLSDRWSSFVNFESVNSYSSDRGWGSFNIEEAWVRYSAKPSFQLKMGLLIPKFNRLNEIKTRMPLLPYIVRPLVYESSLTEVIADDEYIPRRAYIQAYGYVGVSRVKLDYAAYLGNSAQVNGDPNRGITGVDTTDNVMGGGRLGLRHKDTMLGFSFTGEHIDLNDFAPAGIADTLGVAARKLDVARTRLGLDFSTRIGRVAFETEFIKVLYDEDIGGFDLDKDFGYATLGYQFSDRWFAYLTYWETREGTFYAVLDPIQTVFRISSGGFACTVNDRVTLKGQFGTGKWEAENSDIDLSEFDFEHTGVAVSVFF